MRRLIRRGGTSLFLTHEHALMHTLASHSSVGEEQTGLNVLVFEKRKFSENGVWAIPRSQHSQDVLNCDSHVANNGLAT